MKLNRSRDGKFRRDFNMLYSRLESTVCTLDTTRSGHDIVFFHAGLWKECLCIKTHELFIVTFQVICTRDLYHVTRVFHSNVEANKKKTFVF